MFNFICKSMPYVKCIARKPRISPTHELYFLQHYPLSSSSSSASATLKSISKTSDNQQSFAVSYLVNSCGFSPERAISVSRYTKFETPKKPDSVVAFLKKHGFTKTQILDVIRRYPQVLLSDPKKTLLPKLQYFHSRGVSSQDIAKILSISPTILKSSLENQIIPSFDFLKNLVKSKEKTILAIKRCGRLLCRFQTRLASNIAVLRELGTPESTIAVYLINQPRCFVISTVKFNELVEKVKRMGFDPVKMKFIGAMLSFRFLSKSSWEKKVEVFKKCGWSEDDIFVAFGKHPWCMLISEKKIVNIMAFLVNEMGLKSSDIARMPTLLSLSFEKRVVPRCSVYQILYSKGLINKDISIKTMLVIPEKYFLNRFVKRYEEEAPELLKVYQEKLTLSM